MKRLFFILLAIQMLLVGCTARDKALPTGTDESPPPQAAPDTSDNTASPQDLPPANTVPTPPAPPTDTGTVSSPQDESTDSLVTIPFVWQTEQKITPAAAPDVDVAALNEAFFDMTTDTHIYCLEILESGEKNELRFYTVKDGAAYFLFALGDSLGLGARDKLGFFSDFNADGVNPEIFYYEQIPKPEWTPSETLCVAQYTHGVLRTANLADLLGCYMVKPMDKYYGTFVDSPTDPLLKAGYLFDPMNECFVEVITGVPDKQGSWAGIGNAPVRAANWRQIVENSDFRIGAFNGEYQEFGTYPVIDGSTVCVPLGMEFARQHLGMTDDEARSFVYFNTTHDAYYYLITKSVQWLPYRGTYKSGIDGPEHYNESYQTMELEHPVDIIFATYPSDEETALAEQYGEPLVIEPICADAFVFIVNKSNPVDSLTLEQVRGIYSGEITNWNEVGGNDEPIMAYQREPNSGSQSGMEQLVMKGKPMMEAPTVLLVLSMEGLIETVAEYDNGAASIGYSYKYYVEILYKNDNIKILNIDGYAPSDTANYPLTVNYYGVIRENDGPAGTGRKFLDWILSEEGQECIAQAGYDRR